MPLGLMSFDPGSKNNINTECCDKFTKKHERDK